jgi:hypothetical protein
MIECASTNVECRRQCGAQDRETFHPNSQSIPNAVFDTSDECIVRLPTNKRVPASVLL